MAVKFEINMTNKWLYSLIVVGVFLALGVGVYAYQSNMRAGNPPVMGHSAGEIHVENSAGEIVSLQDALDGLYGSSGSPTWTPVDISLGELRYTTGTTTYDIPSSIPTSAKEILVYVWEFKGRGGAGGIGEGGSYKIYTSQGSNQYVQKIAYFEYDNYAWTFNSDNLWFPITAERKIYVNLEGDISGNKNSRIEILGYR
jgi:hypothetical protein